MIDEWCERQVDRLCAFVPAYFGPRATRFCCTAVGWRLYLYGSSLHRRVFGMLSSIQWIEKEEPDLLPEEAPGEPEDPALQGVDPAVRREIERWNEEQKAWEEKTRQEKLRSRTPQQRLKDWWAGRHERAARREARWEAREAAAQQRAGKRQHWAAPAVEAVRRSRFAFMLLMTALSVLGTCGQGGNMGYMAAACCAMWLATAFEMGYEPACSGVRQRYLATMLLRAAGFLLLLPMYFGGYIRQGVSSNVVLQSAMLVLLFAHAAFFLPLVAANRRQPALLRALSGVLGAVPALTAAAAVALAASLMARAQPLPAAGMAGAVGALMAFCADRLMSVTELGGIRLRYTPVWISVFLETGFALMVVGAWTAAGAI